MADLTDDQHTRLRKIKATAEQVTRSNLGAVDDVFHDAAWAADIAIQALDELDRLRGIVRDVAGEALPYDTVQTGYASSIYVCVFCEEQRHQPHDETCPWRRAKEVFPDA